MKKSFLNGLIRNRLRQTKRIIKKRFPFNGLQSGALSSIHTKKLIIHNNNKEKRWKTAASSAGSLWRSREQRTYWKIGNERETRAPGNEREARAGDDGKGKMARRKPLRFHRSQTSRVVCHFIS